jgi:hypothetical protein
MKGRRVAFGAVFCIAMLFVSGASADQPEGKGKPDKPRVPGQTKAECIVFSGNSLNSVPGGTVIEGCCLNAGPWPKYTMDLDLGRDWPNGEIDGYLHIGSWFPGPDGGYVVQFWNYDINDGPPGDDDFLFEIWGGKVERDRKSKLIRVTFPGDESGWGKLWVYSDGYPGIPNTKIGIPIPDVSFVLERTSDLSYCE